MQRPGWQSQAVMPRSWQPMGDVASAHKQELVAGQGALSIREPSDFHMPQRAPLPRCFQNRASAWVNQMLRLPAYNKVSTISCLLLLPSLLPYRHPVSGIDPVLASSPRSSVRAATPASSPFAHNHMAPHSTSDDMTSQTTPLTNGEKPSSKVLSVRASSLCSAIHCPARSMVQSWPGPKCVGRLITKQAFSTLQS